MTPIYGWWIASIMRLFPTIVNLALFSKNDDLTTDKNKLKQNVNNIIEFV